MNYYEQFKPEAETFALPLAEKIYELIKIVKRTEKNLADEKENAENLRQRIAKLKELSVVSLTDDANSFEKFKTSLKKLTAELDTSEEIIITLESEVLPKKRSEFELAQANLKIKLNSFLLEKKAVANKKINELLVACVNERQNFLDDFAKIYGDYGLIFIISDENFCPSPWNASEIRDLQLRLGMETPPLTPQTENTPATVPPEGTSLKIDALNPLPVDLAETTKPSDNEGASL